MRIAQGAARQMRFREQDAVLRRLPTARESLNQASTSNKSRPAGLLSRREHAYCGFGRILAGPHQEAHLVALYAAGEHTVGELEELFSITRSTVYRAVARSRSRLAT